MTTARKHFKTAQTGNVHVATWFLAKSCGKRVSKALRAQAHYFSTRLLYQEMSPRQLEDEVIRLMVRVKERQAEKEARRPGRPNITLEYANGHRRDTLRG